MRVSIVIPNWNGVSLMKKHLRHVVEAASRTEIIIADDASTDGSVAYIRNNFPGIIIVEHQKHEGFASNVNAGVARAAGDVVVLLNTDVEPESGFLSSLIPHFKDSDVFAVGCLEKSAEGSETVFRGRGIARWEKGYYIHSRGTIDRQSTAWVSGGSGAFRRSMWDKLGGMDTLYNPFYWEDIDISYRARKAGWKTLFESKSIVRHYHQQGKIMQEFSSAEVKRIAYRNQFIFIWKNVTDVHIILQHIIWTPVQFIRAIVLKDILMIQGYIWALQYIGKIIGKRIIQKKLYKRRDIELNVDA